MPQEYRPLAMFFGATSASGELSFNTLTGELRISSYVSETQRFLSLCDGKRTFHEIRALCVDIPEQILEMILRVCNQYGLIVDSRKVYEIAHQSSLNPQFFQTDLGESEIAALQEQRTERALDSKPIPLHDAPTSYLEKLLKERRTTRVMSNHPLPQEVFAGLLRATYGHKHYHSAPSAGALYPLNLYVIVNTDQCVPPGVYYYNSSEEQLYLVTNKDTEVRTFEATANVGSIEYSAILVVTANLQRSGQKYSNRGYRYVLTEVGHVAQNAQLYCAEAGLGVTEYGGYSDELLSALLDIQHPNVPLLCLFVGTPAKAGEPATILHELREQLIGPGKPLLSAAVTRLTAPKLGSCWWANAEYRSVPKGELGLGSAATATESSIKAISEAYERWASSQVRTNWVGSAHNSDVSWIDPTQLEPLEPWQYKHYPALAKFNPNKSWEWVKGYKASTYEEVMVPIDLVFYPLSHDEIGRYPCRLASSSGVAAHYTAEAAKEKALLELIERDALMVTWMTRGLRDLYSIPFDELPSSLQEASTQWGDKGRTLKFIDLRIDGPPVVLAVIYSNSAYPALSVGCASATTYEECCIKAYQEAELGLIATASNSVRLGVEYPWAVKDVGDHSRFYNSLSHLHHLSWLLEVPERTPRNYEENASIEDLVQRYDPIFVDLTPNPASPLKVWRALSLLLVPMSFGFGTELISHPRLTMLKFKRQALPLGLPHFFS